MYHFLFPNGALPDEPDEMFADQYVAVTARGFAASICSDRVLAGVAPLRGVSNGSTVVYRGWMTTLEEYANLIDAIARFGSSPLTSLQEYLAAHYLPNWYPSLADLTAETRVFPEGVDLVKELRKLGWGTYFIKDFVKSLKTGHGSVVRDPEAAPAVVTELRESRGRLEGGICVRRVEDYESNSEQRYFVLNGRSHAANGKAAPSVVDLCAERISSPFFSVDVARRSDGELRVVEIGDGQVSDVVGWTASEFASIWLMG